jgi:hypothetical protein
MRHCLAIMGWPTVSPVDELRRSLLQRSINRRRKVWGVTFDLFLQSFYLVCGNYLYFRLSVDNTFRFNINNPISTLLSCPIHTGVEIWSPELRKYRQLQVVLVNPGLWPPKLSKVGLGPPISCRSAASQSTCSAGRIKEPGLK